MASRQIQQLLQAAQQSGLISAADLKQLTAESLADKSPTQEALAAELVNRRLLSSYQAELLLAGRAGEAVVAERYRVLEKLGEGGMGAVYKAQDTRLDRLVAIKVLPPHMLQDTDAIARFQRESRALAKLSHPNIVQAFDCGEDRGRHFLVMEFIDGPSLAKRLRDQRRIAPTIAADYIHQAALGLQHAHERGVVHRDVKPANLLLADLGAASPLPADAPTACANLGNIKILDLGLARFLQDQIARPDVTREGAGMGTPDYMAPEQFRDAHRADARADIYALGCTLYHLLAGGVPFPGSSLSEKWKAHEEQEPLPLEELCPEAPAGLMLVAQRLMAKRPAERFQTAAEAADALAPYIAGSSPSTARLRSTLSWQGSQLTTGGRAGGRRRLWWLASAAAAVLLATALAVLPSWLQPSDRRLSSGQSSDGGAAGTANDGGAADTAASKSSPGESPKSKVVTIPNGLTVAKDGTGQYTTISAALAQAKPGMTIRVLDQATYSEPLAITNPTRHAGLVLEAPRGAVLDVTQAAAAGISIQDVPHVTVRGLAFRAGVSKAVMVHAKASAPGLVLEGLRMKPGPHNDYDGIYLETLQHSPADDPVVVRKCVLESGKMGISILGLPMAVLDQAKYPPVKPCARVLIHDNDLASFPAGILAKGHLTHVHIVGNRIWGGATFGGIQSAVQLENLHADSEDVLVANNSVFSYATALRVWDDAIKGRVTVRNNLVVATPSQGADMLFIDSGGNPVTPKGPGDVAQVAKNWQLDHNWREFKPPARDELYAAYWIPPGKDDVCRDEIAVLSRTVGETDFLRPAKGSPLATGGAGGDLPSYVGAVPPEGQAAWDWQRTWRARVPAFLTVAKDGTGQFTTIGAALAEAKPGTTIRVLDQAAYRETLAITSASRHAGLVLEATNGATLEVANLNGVGILIEAVPRVTVRGLKFRSEAAKVVMIHARMSAPGLLLENLELKPGSADGYDGIYLETLEDSEDDPAIVRKCIFNSGKWGIAVVGMPVTLGNDKYPPAKQCARVSIYDNNIAGCATGIVAQGHLTHVHIVGNRIWGGSQFGAIQLGNLHSASEDVLVANNTVSECRPAIRLWDDRVKGRVTMRNNLLLGIPGSADMLYVDSGGSPSVLKGPGDMSQIAKGWQMDHNWREVKPPARDDVYASFWIPPGAQDVRRDEIAVLSRAPSDADFLRPAKDSPLAKAGAGVDLPGYVGAVPPEGQPPWDWQRTWQARDSVAGKAAKSQ